MADRPKRLKGKTRREQVLDLFRYAREHSPAEFAQAVFGNTWRPSRARIHAILNQLIDGGDVERVSKGRYRLRRLEG